MKIKLLFARLFSETAPFFKWIFHMAIFFAAFFAACVVAYKTIPTDLAVMIPRWAVWLIVNGAVFFAGVAACAKLTTTNKDLQNDKLPPKP